MLTVFQVCFFVGISLILLSFILGNLFDATGFEGLDLDFDFFGVDIFLPINFTIFLLFAMTFGGVGWIASTSNKNIPTFIIIILAIIIGLIVSMLVSYLVLSPLKKAQNTSSPSVEELVGMNAIVSETIITNGFGEIRYHVNGNSFTSPAKSTKGVEIKVGTNVAICWIENYVFYVVSIEDM